MESDFTGVRPNIGKAATSRYRATQRTLIGSKCSWKSQQQCTRQGWDQAPRPPQKGEEVQANGARQLLYGLLFTASLVDLVKRISETSRMAPITIALSARLKSGQL